MTRRPFPTTPAYLQSLRGLHRLHALTLAGQSQSPEADAVRDSLDGPWYALSEAERERIGGLSEDLYSLSDPLHEPSPADARATSQLMEAVEARQAGDWDRALELLRRWGRHLSPADLSFQRGCVWQEAGDHATAALFFEHAARLDPENGLDFALYLDALEKSDPGAAVGRAGAILADDGAHPPIVVLRAASILFRSTRPMDSVDQMTAYRGLVGVLERTLPRAPTPGAERDQIDTSIRLCILRILGFCHFRLGDNRAGLRYFDEALGVAPDDPGLLTARGLSRYGISPEAVDDFARAIDHEPRAVWPYFFLAHHNLVTSRFEDCLKACDRALDLPAQVDLKARLHEWRAIARSELGFSEAMVRSDFEEAVRLAPEDDEIRRNFEAFNRSGGQPGARPHDWAMPRASAIQALYRAEPGPLLPAA